MSLTRYTCGSGWLADFALDDIRLGDCVTLGCMASDGCHIAGSCDFSTGRCSAESVKPDGTAYNLETTVKLHVTLKHT